VTRDAVEAELRAQSVAVVGSYDISGLASAVTDPTAAVVLLDVSGMDISKFRNVVPQDLAAKILMFGIPRGVDEVVNCARSGAAGLLDGDAPLPELLEAISTVAVGRTACSCLVAVALAAYVARTARAEPSVVTSLTPREAEVASLVADGLSNIEIARSLEISLSTVKIHVHGVLQKLRVDRRAQVAERLGRHSTPIDLSSDLDPTIRAT
jgi:DNA-binding NarL/FixJ family response regulator